MQERVISIVLALLMACAGCAGRIAATPESPPQPTPKAKPKAPTPAPPVTGTESPNQPGAQVAAAPTSPPIGVLTPTPTPAPAPAGQAPPATVSTYVYSPQDGAPPATALADDASPALPAGELQLLVVASATQVAVSEVVTVDVMASSSTAVVDAPLHLTFDPNVVEFVDGVPGDFLTQGGSSVVFLADGRSRPGDVALAAGRVTREQGASGSGLLCRVRFRGVGAGTTAVAVGQAKAWGTSGEQLTVRSTGTTVAVR